VYIYRVGIYTADTTIF